MKALFQKYLCKDRFSDYRPLTSRERRTVFQQDHDRIVFSTAFRRLQNKTQVFSLPTEKVFVHNRLTHSIEVESVGRSLGIDTACGLLDRYPELNEVLCRRPAWLTTWATLLSGILARRRFAPISKRVMVCNTET